MSNQVSAPAPKWREENGIIYFSVTSDGTTGPKWITRLEAKGFQVKSYTKSLLRSPGFQSTKGVTSEIAVLKGSLWDDKARTTKNVRAEAKKRKLTAPNAEVACLIRERFTDEELQAMGFWRLVVMHKSIKDSGDYCGLLCAGRGYGGRWFDVCYDSPVYGWERVGGFAFAVP